MLTIRKGLVLLCAAGLWGKAAAQNIVLPVELRQDSTTYNVHSQAGAPISSTAGTPPGSDGRAPTIVDQTESSLTLNPPTSGQFRTIMQFGAILAPATPENLDTNKTLVGNAENLDLPRFPANSPTVVLIAARGGAPLVSQKISFLFGSVIPVPATDETGTPLPPEVSPFNYWLKEPYSTNNHANAGYYWSPHARSVFAIQAGLLEIVWKKAQSSSTKPDDYDAKPENYILDGGNYYTLYKSRYYVSGSASKTPRKMYWTGASFQPTGKPVLVPEGRVGAIVFAYNKNFPERVAHEFIGPGQSFISDTNRLEETRTIWYDTNVRSVQAYNQEGRVFMEILGDLRDDRKARIHLGFEIIDVIKQPNPVDVTVELGVRLPAYQDNRDDTRLFPEPLMSAAIDSPFGFRHTVENRSRDDFYASAETHNLNDYFLHWMEEGAEGLRWPFIYVRYRMIWPVDPAKYSHYVRPVVGSREEAKKTAVQLPSANPAVIAYQDAFDTPRAEIISGSKFYTYLTETYPAHRTLIRYSVGEAIAFERVFSWLDSRLRANQFAGSVATNLVSWSASSQTLVFSDELQAPRVVNQTVPIGERIKAPTGESGSVSQGSYWAGFVRLIDGKGTLYNPNAYLDPFASGFDLANQSAIIPVNTMPGNDFIEVWWFRRNKADELQGFKPVYWPSAIGHYTVQWPASPREIVMASNDGSGPLDSFEVKGRIYAQNNKAKIGYNPNEEHALVLGGQAYALRDDLNITSGDNYSSKPYVLMEYTAADGRPAMSVFKVLREKPEAGILFDYIVEAGTILQAPMPLPLLALPLNASGVNLDAETPTSTGDYPEGWDAKADDNALFKHYVSFTYEDRKHSHWVYRGVHKGPPVLEAGTYVTNAPAHIAAPRNATAIVEQPFSYTFHVSRRAESLVLSGPTPAWLTIRGLAIEGTPQASDVGTNNLAFTLTDIADDSVVNLSLRLAVDESGIVVAQGVPEIVSTNSYTGTNVTYVGRPPFLAASPTSKNSFTMRFYYKNQESFDWPGLTAPKTNAIVPYLRKIGETGDGTSADTPALEIVYRPVWPVNPPRLELSDTLTLPKNGLPAIRGQTSVEILYQQSIATNSTPLNASAVLHDATREKVSDLAAAGLDKLPDGIRKDTYLGKTFFPNLPPHLAERLFFDPNRGAKGQLVFRGEFKDEIVGEKYLLLNVLRGSDLTKVLDLCPSNDAKRNKWESLVKGLTTIVETFVESATVPGTYVPNGSPTTVVAADLASITNQNSAVDSYALSASGPGQGFVVVIAGNGTAFTPPGEPVSIQVLRVGAPLHTGELKVVPSANPLNEMITLQHSADLAGKFADFEYQWMIGPPVDGLPPAITPAMTGWTPLAQGNNINFYTLGGAGVQVLSDNYLIMRYRAKDSKHPAFNVWSDWTKPQLAEGWIKRVLAGINPFNQRVNDLFNNTVNTDVSLLTQAGHRWEGDVALNLANINNFGLIEIYETVLRRGKMLSIDAGINYGPANDALLLAAGYINDLYMMVGNEAWADANNPTIGIGTKDHTYGDIATSLFAFKGQVPTLLEEELGLLRGRDDFLQPSVEIAPVYNRLFWNYTRGIDAGEIIYALNYNIQENPANGADGVINAADAARMFPQGHGDAYGHYLTALKGYYSLLLDTDFDWAPRTEAVLVLGQPVQVDYLDERKFAAAAAAVARSGRQIFDLTWRRDYVKDAHGWAHLSPTRTNTGRKTPVTRYWGVDHWASRVGQGTYLNWIAGNAILPAIDPDPTHEGIQKVDRTTVPELQELPATYGDLQTASDNAEAGLTPLGLPSTTIPFDINPDILLETENNTHFEQILGRAKVALNNAVVAFNDAKDVTTFMRSEQDSLDDLRAEIAAQELSYTNSLIELYGTPYPDDVGPGKTYISGYSGPDLIHYSYVDYPESTFGGLRNPQESRTFKVDIQTLPSDWLTSDYTNLNAFVKTTDANYTAGKQYIEFNMGPLGFFDKPATWTSRRQSPGSVQQAISEVIAAYTHVTQSMRDAQKDADNFSKSLRTLQARFKVSDDELTTNNEMTDLEQDMNVLQSDYDKWTKRMDTAMGTIDLFKEGIVQEVPETTVVGLAFGGDWIKPVKGALFVAANVSEFGLLVSDAAKFTSLQSDLKDKQESIIKKAKAIGAELLGQDKLDAITELGISLGDVQSRLDEINDNLRGLDDARRNLAGMIAQGDRILQERQVYRQRSAAIIQGFRTRDAAFRVFRNEKLERYKSLFDLAARYSFLAAQAYDYETGLLNTEQGKSFVGRIIQSRALGVMADGEPQFGGSNTGDPGLSSALAEMAADWSVIKGRLGFNNPMQDGTTVSLRTENYRILPAADSDLNWRDVLQAGRKSDLLADSDVRRYCMQISRGTGLPVPGIVLEFSTTVADGLNLFGQPLAAGDHNFSPSTFATKLYALGVSLEGYIGMDHPGANTAAVDTAGGTSPSDPTVTFLDSTALAATPYIYLVPVGVDSMRSPPLGDTSEIRSWQVDDVTIPLPFNIGASDFAANKLFQSSDSLSEPIFGIRKHPAFRPVSTASVFDNIFGTLAPSPFTNRRLIGRSVWNSKWKLVIPGHTLLANPNEGLDRFIQTVTDVKIHLITYSYSGN